MRPNNPDNHNQKIVSYEINVQDNKTEVGSFIYEALNEAELEKLELESKIRDSAEAIKKLTPQCDAVDYALAASSGVLCGLLDVFLVGRPGETVFGQITDEWYGKMVKKFTKLNGCSSLKELEEKYAVPYDQTRPGQAFKEILNITPRNHHFKSLAHNPSLLGLFFSVLDQFSSPNLSHFVSSGELITLVDSTSGFSLSGNNIISKLFCAFFNWIGHLISDVSGSSGSKGRGMGLPSPLWTWSNDVIAIKRTLGIQASFFDKQMNELALQMFDDGYDVRFQTAQGIPVFINEMVTRLLYSIRRLIRYLSNLNGDGFSFKAMWKECEPFTNATVKRMLTVSHSAFCLVDITDVIIGVVSKGGGYAAIYEICMKLNIVGIGRLTISLIGELSRACRIKKIESNKYLLEHREFIVKNYINGLHDLAAFYGNENSLSFVGDLDGVNCAAALEKSSEISKKRGGQSLDNIDDIDAFFRKG